MKPHRIATRLDAHLQRCASLRFDWARWNCGDFAAAWVLQATGRSVPLGLPMATHPRAWAQALRQAGGMRVQVSRQLGVHWRPACLAATGDLVMLPGRLVGEAMGICHGDRLAVVGAPGGVAWRPLEEATACWPIAEIADIAAGVPA